MNCSAAALEAERLASGKVPGIPSAVVRRLAGEVVLPSFEGILEARAGRLDRTRQRLDEVRKVFNPQFQGENWFVRSLEGELALASGDPAAAEAAFAAADPKIKMDFLMAQFAPSLLANNWPSRDGLARVKTARGDLRGAIEAYRVLLTPDLSSKWTAVLQPRYVLERARLLERAGDTAGAKAEYQHFLELWKHADPSLPELAEARRKAR